MPSVDDLRRIIRRIEGSRPPPPAPPPLERVVDGSLVETSQGPVVLVRRVFPLSYLHGRLSLEAGARAPLDTLAVLGRETAAHVERAGLLFLDTETTGLAGGTGTYAFLIGLGHVEGDALVVEQYIMRDLDEEPALLAALEPRLRAARALVTYNGTGFDLPLLETRHILARRPWPTLAHVDLLGPARRVWAPALADCRLGTLEREVLGVVRDDDVPGWEIPSRFFSYLRQRNPAPLVPVLAHNRHDVLSLVVLLGWFVQALSAAPGERAAPELVGLGRLWERRDPERADACYRAALDAGLEGPLAHGVRLRLAAREKRRARWDVACALWEVATALGDFDPRPWEELAKFHEHRRRDVAAAHDLVVSALAAAETAGATTRVREALAYRLARLDRRLAASAER